MEPKIWIEAFALTAAGAFSGYTWALSDATVPALLHASEEMLVEEWRVQYLKGFQAARPFSILNGAAFGYLAYTAPPKSMIRHLHVFAALGGASGIFYALVFLRTTNGALSLRAARLVGEYEGQPVALTYAKNDERARKREENWITVELVERWQWHNSIRTVILVAGTFAGGLGVALGSRAAGW